MKALIFMLQILFVRSTPFIFGVLMNWVSVFTTHGQPVKTGFETSHKSVGLRYSRGFLFAHSALMHAIGRGPNQSLELFIEFQTAGVRPWELYHRLPPWRLLFNVANFSDPRHIGQVYSLGTEMSFPLVRRRCFYLGLSGALGLGFVTRPFHPVKNNTNAAVSSPVNYLLRPGLEVAFPIHRQARILAGLSFTHWSVGALTMPNLGMNIPAFHVAVTGGWDVRSLNSAPRPPFARPPWQADLLLCGGLKQVYPLGTGFFPTVTLGVWFFRQFTPKSAFPAGIEFFYDGSMKMRMFRAYHSYGYDWQALRAGLFSGYEWMINRFSLYFHFGGYFFWPDRLDTRFYQRIGMRCRVGQKWHVNFSLKSHFFVADFLELGGGYRLWSWIRKKVQK